MANSAQPSDYQQQRRSPGQRPIVLARLPRLGASAPASAAPPTPEPTIHRMPEHLMSEQTPLPEPMPQLDLQTEIQHQLRLHTAHSSRSGSMHTPQQETAAPARKNRPSPTEASMPTGLSAGVFRLHSQLAPHAGLIVALALIASAGLLYWMIVGGADVPAYNSQRYGQELGNAGLGTAHLPEFSQRPTTTDPTTNTPTNTWTEVPLPSPSFRSTQIAQPKVDTPAFKQIPVAKELHFPSTGHPHQLDFTQKGPALPRKPTATAPQPLPEVAQRPTASTNR